MSSVWRPLQNPPVLPKFHLSEEGQRLFNYISRLYHRPIATTSQSQTQLIKDNETWFFAQQSDKFGDSNAQRNISNHIEIDIKTELMEIDEPLCPGNNFDKISNFHCGEESTESYKWNVPIKKRRHFQETESIPSPKKCYSQMTSQYKHNHAPCFSTGHSQRIPHTSQETFYISQASNSQKYRRVNGDNSPPLFK